MAEHNKLAVGDELHLQFQRHTLLNIEKDAKLEIVEIRKRGIMEAAQGVIQRRRLAARVLEGSGSTQ